MKIYTRTGDGGATTLFDGTRIAKSDARVDAYGEVDEANAAVGVARASGVDKDIEDMLAQIQRDLFALGSRLADPAERIAGRTLAIPFFAQLGPSVQRRVVDTLATVLAEVGVPEGAFSA